MTVRYFQRVLQQELDSSGLAGYEFEEIRSLTVPAPKLAEPVVYDRADRPVDRMSVEVEACLPGVPSVPGFVHRYESERAVSFSGLIDGADPSRIVAFGRIGHRGLVTALDPDGRVLWSRRYRAAGGAPLQFTSGLTGSDGDFLLSGSLAVSQSRQHHVVVRTTADGTPIWSFTYAHPQTRFHRALVRLIANVYVFTGWNNQKSSLDNIELVRIDRQGQILFTRRVSGEDAGPLPADNQVAGILPHRNGFLLFGETSGESWDGFLGFFDSAFTLQWGYRVGTPRFDTVRTVIPLSSVEFLIAGVTSPVGSSWASSSYVMRFSRRSFEQQAMVFDLFGDVADRGFAKLVEVDERFYLLAYPAGRLRYARLLELDGA